MMAGRQCISLLKGHSTRLLNNQGNALARSSIAINKISVAALSTSSKLCEDGTSKTVQTKDPKMIPLDDAGKTAAELAHDAALKGMIVVEGATDITAVSVSTKLHLHFGILV